MKNRNHNQIITLSYFLFVLVAPALLVMASVPPPDGILAAALVVEGNETVVTDTVTAKDDDSLRIDNQELLVTGSTFYTRNGDPATLAEIRIGDEARVHCIKGLGGGLVAIRIAARTPTG